MTVSQAKLRNLCDGANRKQPNGLLKFAPMLLRTTGNRGVVVKCLRVKRNRLLRETNKCLDVDGYSE
jgi:hypothetical protein